MEKEEQMLGREVSTSFLGGYMGVHWESFEVLWVPMGVGRLLLLEEGLRAYILLLGSHRV